MSCKIMCDTNNLTLCNIVYVAMGSTCYRVYLNIVSSEEISMEEVTGESLKWRNRSFEMNGN